ncbi:hypothetical protein [Paramagnetospirillum marisnigri]|nr:hypothetical protein [Paramagnetospirillum marisnigri]
MIPRLLLSLVATYLALEGYSILTAPPDLVRQAIAKAQESTRAFPEVDVV